MNESPIKNNDYSPIFIHSIFRSGSTYIFNKFRQSDSNYWCYQEPLNEHLLFAATEPDKLLEINKDTQAFLRHPELDAPYFYEFHAIADKIGQYFLKEFSYDQYFSKEKNDTEKLRVYFNTLMNSAQGRAVFQCCRTAGRIENLKLECGGIHIFLWRNPWDQWWSYKKGFGTNNLLIANAKNLPTYLKALKKELKLPSLHESNTFSEYTFFRNYRLDAIDSYKLFYALWCHAMIEAKPHCQLTISIDKLSTSNAYKYKMSEKLNEIGVDAINFSDCSVPMSLYGRNDGDFFLKIEDYVHNLMLSHGYSHTQIDKLTRLSKKRYKLTVDTALPENSAVRDAMHVREYMQQAEAELVAIQSQLEHDREQAKSRNEQTEIRVEQAESRARLAEAKARQAEKKVIQAEARAKQADKKAKSISSELSTVYNSRSWQITSPLRRSFNLLKKLK